VYSFRLGVHLGKGHDGGIARGSFGVDGAAPLRERSENEGADGAGERTSESRPEFCAYKERPEVQYLN
jgi:hypothetical protein